MRFAEHPATSPYQQLAKNQANYAPLTPLSFLERAADVWPTRTAVIHGSWRADYAELRRRCRRLAAGLARRGVRPGDTVALMLPNVPAMLEAHYGIPMAGAVINALNVRLEAETIAYILDHGEAKVLLTDPEFSGVVADALAQVRRRPLVVDVPETEFDVAGKRLGELTYDELLAEGEPEFEPLYPADEWQAVALGYTSGTTGRPKGVVTHHRGAYLNAIGDILVWDMGLHPTYLWTLPMFHCNGWCFPWAVALQGGTQVCLRRVEAGAIYAAIAEHKVTHLCGAPVVMGMLINARPEQRRSFAQPVAMMTAAAAPPAAVLQAMAELGVRVTHVYGLTEVYGPATVCAWQKAWDALPAQEQARLQARQGVRYPVLEGLAVMDPATMTPVANDGGDARRDHAARPRRDEGLFQGPRGHGGGVHARLVPQRRPRRDARRRLRRDQGPLQGHHHLGRREHLLDRGRSRVVPPSRRARGGGGREARSEMGREPVRVRHAEGGHERQRGRADRALPRDPRPFQGAQDRGVRRAPQNLDRQGAEERPARARAGA